LRITPERVEVVCAIKLEVNNKKMNSLFNISNYYL